MAKVINEYVDSETGHVIREYESGAVYDMTAKRGLKIPDKYAITSDNSREMLRKRHEATQRKIAAAIAEAGGHTGSTDDAIAVAAGLLWKRAISGGGRIKDSYDVIKGLAKDAGYMADQRETTLGDVSAANKASAETLALIVGALMEARRTS